MPRLILIVCLSLSLMAPVALTAAEKDKQQTQPGAAPTQTKPNEAGKLKQPPKQTDMFDIVADKLDVYKKEGQALFQGNVKATRQDVTVKSKTMRLFYDNTTKKLVKMKANSNVIIHMQDRDATCDQAIYMTVEDKLYLSGNVVMTQGKNKATSQTAVIDMKNDIQTITGEPGKQVHISGEATQGGMDFLSGPQAGAKPGTKPDSGSNQKSSPPASSSPATAPKGGQ